jgi:hypothetical protein
MLGALRRDDPTSTMIFGFRFPFNYISTSTLLVPARVVLADIDPQRRRGRSGTNH